MTDKSQLPFLIRLVDDKSPVVRAKVARELAALGSGLEAEIHRQGLSLTREQRTLVDEIVQLARALKTDAGLATGREAAHYKAGSHRAGSDASCHDALSRDALSRDVTGDDVLGSVRSDSDFPFDRDAALRRAWSGWLEIEGENQRLEAALGLLARWQLGSDYHTPLGALLDELADGFRAAGAGGFRAAGGASEPEALSRWLFSEAGRGLRGASPDGLYNPLHSNLIYVIEARRGIPISLASIFMLVGHRLGLDISGCNFPGHFLARACVRDRRAGVPRVREIMFDCYGGGRALSSQETAALRKAVPHEMSARAAAVVIVARTLRNLVIAFEQTGDMDKARFMLALLSELEQATGL